MANQAIPGGALVDGSGTLTGATQQVFAANGGRQYLLIQNIDATNAVWVNFGIAAVADQPSIKLAAGASMEYSAAGTGVVPTAAVNVIGTAASKFTAKQI
jgi:hypothetical protein